MNRSLANSVCILCKNRTIVLRPHISPLTNVPLSRLSSVLQRNASTFRSNTKQKSSDLSPNVAKHGGEEEGIRRRRRKQDLQRQHGMNRTVANLPPLEKTKPKPSNAGRSFSRRIRSKSKSKSKVGTKAESSSPFKALKMQSTLTQIGYGARSAVKRRIEDLNSFTTFPLLDVVQEAIISQALPGLEDVQPTAIQRVAIPVLLGTDKRAEKKLKIETGANHYLLAAETGSGKTLAYLIPCIDSMKRAELKEKEDEALKGEEPKECSLADLAEMEYANKTGMPRVIILVPTAELVDQVGKVVKSFSHHVKFRAATLSSAYSPTVIRNNLSKPGGNDVIVATPLLLANILRSEPSMASRVTHLVIDEADSLLDRSFQPFTEDIIKRTSPSLQKLIMCSATIPRKMDNYLRKVYPNALRLTTPNLHAIPRRVQLSVVDVNSHNYLGSKDAACADTIWNIGFDENVSLPDQVVKQEIKKILVFVNEREKTLQLAQYLVGKGIDAKALNRDTDARTDRATLAEFTGEAFHNETAMIEQDASIVENGPKRKLLGTKVLVTTDIASRGIDTTPVRDVILYDVPHTTVDFIHRLGRTGRMGRRGRGIVLVGKDDRKDVVSEVRHGMYLGQALI